MARFLHLAVTTLAVLAATSPAGAADCSKALTSEGEVTLRDMQLACAPLKQDQGPSDLGKSYMQCVHGHLHTLPCPPGLRWDTSINNCNFQERATCGLPDSNPPSQEQGTRATTRQPDNPTTRQPDNPTTRQPARTSQPSPSDDYYYDDVDDAITEATTTTTTTTTTQPTYKTTRRRRPGGRTRTATRLPPTTAAPTTTAPTTGLKTPTTRSARTTTSRTQTTQKWVRSTEKPPATNAISTTPKSTMKTTGKVVDSRDCPDADTSEGARTLLHGQRACAPLRAEEDESDLGRRFVVCSSRTIHTQECQPGLRFDMKTGLCNWPDVSSCQFEEGIPVDRSATLQPPGEGEPGSSRPARPTNTRRPPTPGRCSPDNCQLPDCFCFGASPTAVPTQDTPMFIMLTFDDAVTSTLYNNYFRPLLVDNDYNLLNPNGCRVKSTFYVSHVNTDYSLVKALWDAGHEIGSHTVHHELPPGNSDEDYPGMVAEIQGLKDEMLKATGNKTLVDSVTGFRSPYLRVAGDVQFDVLRDFGFQYDTSILNINILQGKTPYWPYTLDYVMGECINPPCPTKPYPGMWEAPLNGWIGDDKQGCSMVDACVVGTSSWTATQQQWYQFYKRNFEDYFYPVKVPMPIFTHGFLFANYPNSYSALASWFQDLLRSRDDVWLVTPSQVINWMKNPLSSKEMVSQKWGC